MGKKKATQEEPHVEEVEVTADEDIPEQPATEAKVAKPKKTLTQEQLEKLKIARAKARESQIKNTEKRQAARKLAKENKEMEEREKLQTLKNKNEELKQKVPVAKVEPPSPAQPEDSDLSEPAPKVIPGRKKPAKKPVVIVEDSESESDDSNVIYIKKGRRSSKPSQPQQFEPAPTAPAPVKPQQYQFFNPFFQARFANY